MSFLTLPLNLSIVSSSQVCTARRRSSSGPDLSLGFHVNLFCNQLLDQPVVMNKSLTIVLAFALFICGCSTVSLFYRNADWYLQHKINGYTSFNDQQKKVIKQEVSVYMNWHRKYALPEYIIFLQNLNGAAQYDGQLETGEIGLLRRQLFDLYKRTMAPAIRPAAEILSTLDSKQIQELGRNLAEENQKQKHEYLDASQDEYLDRRADRTINFMEWLAGNMSNDQQQKVRELSRHLPVVSDIYIRQREANQSRLISLLNDHAGKEEVSAFLSLWILIPEATRSPQQQHAIESFELATDEMIAQVHGLLTVRQKGHMHKIISSYIDDMRAENRKAPQDPNL
jgi:Family of unknown function (DUF6279)